MHRKCPPENSKHSGDFDPISAGDSCDMDDPEGAVASPQICGRRRMRPVCPASSSGVRVTFVGVIQAAASRRLLTGMVSRPLAIARSRRAPAYSSCCPVCIAPAKRQVADRKEKMTNTLVMWRNGWKSGREPDPPKVVILLTSTIDLMMGVFNVSHTLSSRTRLSQVCLA